ncbi:MAG: phage tail assembly chaperone [Rubellimicrobium sp.]|nr:phage tail assembly chaperone [Rubellimicrobium sp.]
MSGLDWAGLLRAGLSRLHLRPAEFWALTPWELALMLGVAPGEAPMDRARMDALLRQYPDGKEQADG